MPENPAVVDNLEQALRQAQLEQLKLENEKSRLELAKHQKGPSLFGRLDQWIPLITTLLGILGFIWGVIQYTDQQTQNRQAQEIQAQRQAESTEREFMKPWLDSQREIYMQALSAAAVIANTDDPDQQKRAREEFWELYQGKMVLIETKTISDTTGVTGSMIKFGNCLSGVETCSKSELNTRSRALASAMAESMAATARMTYKEFAANQFRYVTGP